MKLQTETQRIGIPPTDLAAAASGQPVAQLVQVATERRKPGRLKGRIRIGPELDEPLPDEVLAALRGEGE